MARLIISHHPDRVFKDDWWAGHESAAGYRALGIERDELEAFAVVIDADSSYAERLMAHQMVALCPPFVRAERFDNITIGYYPAPDA